MDVRLLYAPMLFGVFLNMILYGVFMAQAFHYYLAYPTDKLWIKRFVLYLLIVETINTGCDMYLIYQPLLERFGLSEALEYLPTMIAAEPITIVSVSTPIQLFLARRVWIFTKSRIITGVVIAFAIASLAGGLWTMTQVVKVKKFSQTDRLHMPALVWLLGGCAADLLITVVMVYALHRKKTGFVATDDVIAKIIRMTVQTGLLTTLMALGDVLCFMTQPSMLNFLFDVPLSKLYSNCLLSMLNARATLWSSSHSHSYTHNPVVMSPIRNNGLSIDAMSPTGGTQSGKSLESRPDVEYGVTITKVMETSEDYNSVPSIHTQ